MVPKEPKSTKTNLTLPLPLATALDDVLGWAKHQKYVGRSEVRNDLIRYLLQRGVQELRAEMAPPKRKR